MGKIKNKKFLYKSLSGENYRYFVTSHGRSRRKKRMCLLCRAGSIARRFNETPWLDVMCSNDLLVAGFSATGKDSANVRCTSQHRKTLASTNVYGMLEHHIRQKRRAECYLAANLDFGYHSLGWPFAQFTCPATIVGVIHNWAMLSDKVMHQLPLGCHPPCYYVVDTDSSDGSDSDDADFVPDSDAEDV